jgi:hypothetical protein
MKTITSLKALTVLFLFAGSFLVAHAQDASEAQARANAIVSGLSAAEQAALLEGDIEVATKILIEYGIDFDDAEGLRTAVAALMQAAANLQGTQPSPRLVQQVSGALLRATANLAREQGASVFAALNNVAEGLKTGADSLATQWSVDPVVYNFAVNSAVGDAFASITPSDNFVPPIVNEGDEELVVASPESGA